MKLLNCTKCNDIVSLASSVTRVCLCGASKGRYLQNGVTALVTGNHVRVLGMLNTEYNVSKQVPVIPFHTYYRWFPILLEPAHNVLLVDSGEYDTYPDQTMSASAHLPTSALQTAISSEAVSHTGTSRTASSQAATSQSSTDPAASVSSTPVSTSAPVVPSAPTITRHRAKCLDCNQVIESLHHYHFVTCACGHMSLDGGGGAMYERRILGNAASIEMMPTDDPDENKKATSKLLGK